MRCIAVFAFFISLFFTAISHAQPPKAKEEVAALQTQLQNTKGAQQIPIILQLAKLRVHREPHATIELVDNALIRHQPQLSALQHQKLLYYRGIAYMMTRQVSLLWKDAEQLAEITAGEGLTEGVFLSNHLFSMAHKAKRNLYEAYRFTMQALSVAEELDDKRLILEVIVEAAGTTYRRSGAKAAVPIYLRALTYAEDAKNQREVLKISTNLGEVFYDLRYLDKTEYYLHKALEVHKHNLSEPFGIKLNALLISYYLDVGREQEIEPFVQYLKLANTEAMVRAPVLRKMMPLTLSKVAQVRGNLPEALKYAKQAEGYLRKFADANLIVEALQANAQIHSELGMHEDAVQYAHEILDMLPRLSFDYSAIEASAYLVIFTAYEARADTERALEAYQKYTAAKIVSLERDKNVQVARLEVEFDSERKQNEIKSLAQDNRLKEAEIASHRAQLYSWIAGLAFLLTAAVLFYYRQLQKKKLATEQLRLNEQLLEKKNQLFAHVSHEFRTPLTLVIGPLHQVQSKIRSAESKKALSLANINAKRLLRMVDQLLDLAKLDNVDPTRVAAIDLSDIAKHTVDSLHSLFEAKSLTLRAEIAPHLKTNMPVDVAEKILVNLLTNAVKYTEHNGHIALSLSDSAGQIVLKVADNGIGIAASEQTKVFERFIRVHDTNLVNVPGAGIGLALVKELVERFAGTIDLTSEPGKGSEFTVILSKSIEGEACRENRYSDDYLAQEKEVLASALEAKPDLADTASLTASDEKPQLLIIEDHPDMRQFIAQSLGNEYQVLLAQDGEEGIKLAIEQVPDLIITDLMMPKRNGYEVARTLRDNLSTSHIPIIMLTAKGDDESRLEAWKTDIDEYIEKPFNQEELLLRAKNLLNIRQLISLRLSEPGLAEEKSAAREKTRLVGLSEKDKGFIEALDSLIASNYQDNKLAAKQVYPVLAMSERQFHRKMKALLGQSFSDYLRAYRLKMGAEQLMQGTPVTNTALDCGFSSQSYFSQCFKAQFGISPSEYQNSQVE